MAPFSATPSMCKYGDEAGPTSHAKGRHGRDGIEGARDLLCSLHNLQSALSFTKKQVKDALQLPDEDVVRQDKERGETSTKSWASKMTKQEQPEWLETTQRRVRDTCMIVAQGQLKSQKISVGESLAMVGGA